MVTDHRDIIKRSEEFRVNGHADHKQVFSPSIAVLADGGFVITWEVTSGPFEDLFDIYAQRYNSLGEKSGDEFLVNTYTDSGQRLPSITALADGGFVITWHSRGQDGSSYGVYAQRYNSLGEKSGDEFLVNTYTDGSQASPSIAALADGGFVITWHSERPDGLFYDIYAQRYNSLGEKTGDEFLVNSSKDWAQILPSIAALADGGFVISWHSEGQEDGSSHGIYGQRYNSLGEKSGDKFLVSTDSIDNPLSIAALADGGFIIPWQFWQGDYGYGIYAQRYNAVGEKSGDKFLVGSSKGLIQEFPSIAAMADGSFIIVGTGGMNLDSYSEGVYAQRYTAVTATLEGTDGADILTGTPEQDIIFGLAGDDTIIGLADNDLLIGEDGNDQLDGGIGNDTLAGGAGGDIFTFSTALGENNIDLIADFTVGEDKIQLDPDIFISLSDMEAFAPAFFAANSTGVAMDGHDYIVYNTETGALYYDADGNGEGAAVQFAALQNLAAITAEDFMLPEEVPQEPQAIIGTDGDDSLYGTNEADIIEGLAGDDMLRGYGGADLIDGDAGNDLAYGGDGDDTVNGGAGNDSLYGNNGADLLAGGAGDDFLYGGKGKDSLNGGAGNDGLYGGTGNDVVSGGAGADMVQGGRGNDTLAGGADNDSLYGGSGSDSLDGGAGMDFVNGGGGADFLSGGAGNDTVMGGADNDILHGNEGDDLLTGQQGDDNLDGGEGNDLLIGGIGDDTLVGGSGMDTLFGKEGNDLFVINGDSGDIDSIIDFASGDDHLQLSGEIFAGLAAGELGEDLFAANATGSAMDADDRILYNTDTGALFYDADGNGEGAAVQLAILTNKEDVQATDILVA